MSIYPGEKPHYGTITQRQYQTLQMAPEMVEAMQAIVDAFGSLAETQPGRWPEVERAADIVRRLS